MILAQLKLQKKLIIIAEPQELTQTFLSSVTVPSSHLAMHVGLYVNNDILVR